jgi:hypothetical protein
LNSSSLPLPDHARQTGRPEARDSTALGPGTLFSRHAGTPIGRRTIWLGIVPVTALVLLVLAYGLWRGYYGYTRYGMVAAIGWSRPWLAFGAAAGLLGLIWLLLRWRASRRFVALHEDGIHVHLGGRYNRWLPWEDLEGVTVADTRRHLLGLTTNRQRVVAFYPKSGGQFRLDDRFQQIDRLLHGLKTLYFPRLQPELGRAFRGGRSLRFGPVEISRGRLALQGKDIPWETVQNIRLESGSLLITRTAGRPLRVPAHRIPNLEVLLHILREGGPHEAISNADEPHSTAQSR